MLECTVGDEGDDPLDETRSLFLTFSRGVPIGPRITSYITSLLQMDTFLRDVYKFHENYKKAEVIAFSNCTEG